MRAPKNQAAEMVIQMTEEISALQTLLNEHIAFHQDVIQKKVETLTVLESVAEWEELVDNPEL